MKFKKTCLSTELNKLYGTDNYQSHVEQGREYWYYFSRDSEIIEGWYKIKITYVRSGCAFYVFVDEPQVAERFFPTSCFMASRLVFAEIDPIEDLKEYNFGSDYDKKMICFDAEHTIVHNWPNEKTIEIDEDDDLFSIFLITNEVEKTS